MKRFSTIKKRLGKELSERCFQMGIPATEIPKVCWSREQYKWYTTNKPNNKRLLGQANFKKNTILVDLDRHKLYGYKLSGIRNTMVHELVHMRWQNQRHGKKFRELINRVISGEQFPVRNSLDLRPL